MTQATNTALGEIKLAGDLAGSSNALAPELTVQAGVAPGAYTAPQLTVNAKGIITAIANNPTGLANLIPSATSTTKGIVQVGSGLAITNGLLSVNFTTASASTLGAVKIGSGLTINGAGSVSIADATTSSKGIVTVPTSGGLVITSGALSVPTATAAVAGVMKPGSGLTMTNDVLSANVATSSTLGTIKVGTGLTAASGVVSTTFPDATTTTKGVIQVGSGLSIASGVLSATAATAVATTSAKGLVQIGAGINVDANGVISSTTADATSSSKGLVMINTASGNLAITNGVLSANIPIATSTTSGVVQIGAGIAINSGVITTSTTVPDATASSKGIVQIGAGLSVTNGVVSALPATSATAGVVQIGAGLSIDGSGNLSSTLPAATATTRGAIKVGYGLVMDINTGVLSVNTSQQGGVATTTQPNFFYGVQSTVPVDLGPGVNLTIDGTSSNVYTATLTQNVNLTVIAAPVYGATYKLFVKQDATGGRTMTTDGRYRFISGSTFAIGTAPNQVTMLEIIVGGATAGSPSYLIKPTIFQV